MKALKVDDPIIFYEKFKHLQALYLIGIKMENFEHPDAKIQDIMTVNPIIIRKNESVHRAAKLMKKSGVGSLVVLDQQGDLEGIITENDIVFDAVAEGIEPTEINVKEIMSYPVHTIEGDKTIEKCAEMMADMEVRRLPVMRNGEMVGMITENDILHVSPALMDITREYARINYPEEEISEYEEPPEREISGYCESCGTYSDRLKLRNTQLMCPECR